MANRAALMMQPDGLIGSSIIAVEDLLRNDPDNCVIVDYDEFCAEPEKVIGKIYQVLDRKTYDHEFTNIESTATDADALYHFKYPHDGSGEVKQSPPRKLPPDIAQHIIHAFQYYAGKLGYTT